MTEKLAKCLYCKGTGKVKRISYVNPSETVEETCPGCKGSRMQSPETFTREDMLAAIKLTPWRSGYAQKIS